MVVSRPAVWRSCAAAALAVACGGGADSVAVDPLPAAVTQGGLESASPGSALAPRPVGVSASGGDVRWHLSRRTRALDDLDNVVAYRAADAVTGSDAVVLHARCYGDRTEVELDLGVSLGDDIVTDGDVRTKRVLVRFVPAAVRALVYDVGLEGRSVVVGRPLGFLRDLVDADSLVVQTVSAGGTTVFAEFVVTALAYQRLLAVSEACGWILDPVEARRAESAGEEAMRAAERAEVLATYVGVPIRDGIERFGVEYGDLFIDLPAPVGRAYLGFGVSIGAVEIAVAQGLGIVCVAGAWVASEIVLRECYVEGSIDAGGKPKSGAFPDPAAVEGRGGGH